MSDSRFPILGTVVPSMLGRDATLQRMINALTKSVPDHLQVVGPRFAGKTVILHELATRLRQTGSPYSAVLVWDLGHQTPETDMLFMQRLARELASTLKANHPDYADHLKESQENIYQGIVEVLDELKEKGSKVLIILDGFDKPLSNGKLTRNLWDQLRELALKSSLRLVTASRRTLRELIRHPDAQTSDFWNIFNEKPVRVGCFDEDDLNAIQMQMPELTYEAGAKTELWNASNGFPVLMLGVINVICETVAEGRVSAEAVRAACDAAFPALRDKIDAIWIDCPPASQYLFKRVLSEGSVPHAGIATAHTEPLAERGFVHIVANKLQRPSSLLRKYLEDLPHEGNAIHRLFSAADAYQRNFKAIMERRLEHLDSLDPSLKRYLERGTEEFPDYPSIFLANVRGIADQAFELIWKAEIPQKQIPLNWIATWQHNKERGIEQFRAAIPGGVHRVRLLNLMTGTKESPRCAKYVTKGTYVLMNAVHAFGDFGQHQDGVQVDPCMAYSALHLCMELAAALKRELPK